MILGRVVGEVWATRRHTGLCGRKLLLIEPRYWYCPPFQVAHLVAVDALGAGVGEDVIVCLGEPARRSLIEGADQVDEAVPTLLPIEATVMAIVDCVALDERAATFPTGALKTVLSLPVEANIQRMPPPPTEREP